MGGVGGVGPGVGQVLGVEQVVVGIEVDIGRGVFVFQVQLGQVDGRGWLLRGVFFWTGSGSRLVAGRSLGRLVVLVGVLGGVGVCLLCLCVWRCFLVLILYLLLAFCCIVVAYFPAYQAIF